MMYRAGVAAAIVASGGAGTLQAQTTRTIAGRIIDLSTAQPISRGQVTVAGSRIVDHVRPDGVFVLHVPVRDVRLLTRVDGYQPRSIEVPVDQEVAIIALEPLGVQLEPIVVTGMDRRSLTTSAASLTGTDVSRVPAASVEQALQGKLPGADVQQNSGAPGGDFQLRLRGVTTILGSVTPLYVLDGTVLSDATARVGLSTVTGGEDFLPSRIADLNPGDIQSVAILKGGAATTRYGSKGANGVVVITTKRGRRNPD